MFVPVEVAPFDLDQWQYSRHGRLGSNWVSVAQNCWYQIVVFPSPVGLRKPLCRFTGSRTWALRTGSAGLGTPVPLPSLTFDESTANCDFAPKHCLGSPMRPRFGFLVEQLWLDPL